MEGTGRPVVRPFIREKGGRVGRRDGKINQLVGVAILEERGRDGRPTGRCGRPVGHPSSREKVGEGEGRPVGFARLPLIVKGPEGTAEFGRWVGR